MRTTAIAFACCLGAGPLAAQGFLTLPATANPATELNSYTLPPFMQPNTRLQAFFDQAEVGAPVFVADQLQLRFDGPIPQVGAPGPFSIQRLQLRLGTSAVPTPGAVFAANLTQPLTTVFDGPWTYLPDNGSAFPHPWGGTNGTLTFPFDAPVAVVVGPGEWLVVELVMEGNNIASFGFAHAILDGAATTGGPVPGSTQAYGQGCAAGAGQPVATASVGGVLAPTGVVVLGGQNLGADTFALGIVGWSDLSGTPPLPGTTCSLLTSLDLLTVTLTDSTGAVAGPWSVVHPVPADAALSGLVAHAQLVSLVPAANPSGLVFSDGVQLTLGSWSPPGRGTHFVVHDLDAAASLANSIRAFGPAMRLRTL